jgi:hypothetical protein
MSYEGEMLEKLAMPTKKEVANALLIVLFKHNGIVKEFSSGEDIVNEVAGLFSLNEQQRSTVLERIYRKENRIVKTPLWHRLLFRAADYLANSNLITRPAETMKLTNQKEWMLTEKGFNLAANLLSIPPEQKDMLPVKSFELQREINYIQDSVCPANYSPLGIQKTRKTVTKEMAFRSRVFRQAIIETYKFQCCVCGLKIKSPDNLSWEVEAAHIVPYYLNGKDDVWNGVALCRLHHWAFDAGWFSFSDDYQIMLSAKYRSLPAGYGKFYNADLFQPDGANLLLPQNRLLYPHQKALEWHRENVFYKNTGYNQEDEYGR